MLKILYAANNSYDSKIRLWRFLQSIENNNYQIKIAAYKKSSIPQNVDWTLDSLLNIFNDTISFDSDNLKIYYEQVKYFNPDLIISDLEPFTSYVANLLNIKLWQVSPLLLNYGLSYSDKYKLGIRNKFSDHFKYTTSLNKQLSNILDNSERKFIYSHFVDLPDKFKVNENYSWVRPYYLNGNELKTCSHTIVGATLFTDLNINIFLNKFPDSVLFSKYISENYSNLLLKDFDNEIEYICNLKNSDIFLCQGHTSLLADAFYNEKYSLIFPDFSDLECLTNGILGDYLNTSCLMYSSDTDINTKKVKPIIDTSVKYLHQHIEEL